jgi:hypothetical protein
MGFLGIPGLSFSLKRAVGISTIKHKIATVTSVPTTRQGQDQKVGRTLLKWLTGR